MVLFPFHKGPTKSKDRGSMISMDIEICLFLVWMFMLLFRFSYFLILCPKGVFLCISIRMWFSAILAPFLLWMIIHCSFQANSYYTF